MRSLDHLEGIGAHNAERARLDTPPQNGTSACARDQIPIRPNSRPDPKHHIAELGRKPGTDAFFDLKTHPDGAMYHDLKIVRFDGGLFFANAGALEDHLRQLRVQSGTELTGVILSMEGVDYIDTEGSDSVREIAQAGRDLNIDLHLARVKPQVLEVLERDGAIDVIGADRVHADIEHAVEFHLSRNAST